MGGLVLSPPRRLLPEDDVSGFCSGVELVDTWFRKRARRAESAGTAVTYAVFDGRQPVGFYALASHSLERSQAFGWLARNTPKDIPVILLGMLGVDQGYQGQGVGAGLLRDAILRSASAAEIIGAKAMVVDPVGDEARSFYERWGFVQATSDGRMMIRL